MVCSLRMKKVQYECAICRGIQSLSCRPRQLVSPISRANTDPAWASRCVIAAGRRHVRRLRVTVQRLTIENTPSCPSISIDRLHACSSGRREIDRDFSARPLDMARRRILPTADASARKLQPGYLDRQGRSSTRSGDWKICDATRPANHAGGTREMVRTYINPNFFGRSLVFYADHES